MGVSAVLSHGLIESASAVFPDEDEVLAGVEYGPAGDDFTGTADLAVHTSSSGGHGAVHVFTITDVNLEQSLDIPLYAQAWRYHSLALSFDSNTGLDGVRCLEIARWQLMMWDDKE